MENLEGNEHATLTLPTGVSHIFITSSTIYLSFMSNVIL